MRSLDLRILLAGFFFVTGAAMAQHTLNLPNPSSSFPGTVLLPNPDNKTYVSVTLSGIPGGFDIANGTYDAWCLDFLGDINPPYSFTFYDSYAGVGGDTNPLPPANVEFGGQIAWNETNWLINHTHGNNNDIPSATTLEVQDAVWTLQDPFYNPGFNDATTAALVSEATTYGATFIPTVGQLQAIILYADGIQGVPSKQDILVGVPVPPPQLTLTCASSTATFMTPYSSALVATGGVPPYTYSIVGSLPQGLMLNATTGAITGTPTLPGAFTFMAKVVDSSGLSSGTVTVSCGITVTPPAPPVVACPPTTGTVGVFYTATLSVSGGIPPYTFSISSGSLPPGLMLNPTTGVISGTPTTGGTFSFTIQVTDSSGLTTGTTTTNCTITIYMPPALHCPALIGTVGVPYASALTVTGGTPPYTFSIVSGSLPTGLTLNTSTGAITGTPTTAGSFSFTAKVVDSSGLAAGTTTTSCTVTISTPTADVFEVNYFSNLNKGAISVNGVVSGSTSPEEYVDIVNPGTAGASQNSEVNGIGNLCADIYVVDTSEELEECCGCIVTPDQLIELPVQANLLSNPNNGRVLHSGAIKIIKSLPVAGTTTKCDPGNPVPTPTLKAWITHTRDYGTTSLIGPGFAVTESEFSFAPLSSGEQNYLSTVCKTIENQSSGAGVCSCATNLP